MKIDNKHWDYTKHAKFYEYRPNYAPEIIETLKWYVNKDKNDFTVADIGAGTGNLTIMLDQENFKIFSVEPNDAMRQIGIERTKNINVNWVDATGIETTLDKESINWVTYGSSFNVMDRDLALREAHRILKKNGYFSCMWNHRNLNDPIQQKAESIIKEIVPHYERGVRRENQKPIIEKNSDLFDKICYMELDFYFTQTIDTYLLAWQSVKNKYWDLETDEGKEIFEKIVNTMKKNLPDKFDIKYTTVVWTAQKV